MATQVLGGLAYELTPTADQALLDFDELFED